MMGRTAHRQRTGSRLNGFTLIELLVGAAVAAVVLSAGFAWLWNVAALATGVDDRAHAVTLASSALRAVAADVHSSVSVAEPPSSREPARSLALVHDHAAEAPEVVLIVWDPARRVVWRNASGTYLADHVTRFDLTYILADGSRVDAAAMSSPDWSAVRAVRVDLAARFGEVVVQRSLEASVGPS